MQLAQTVVSKPAAPHLISARQQLQIAGKLRSQQPAVDEAVRVQVNSNVPLLMVVDAVDMDLLACLAAHAAPLQRLRIKL